MCVLFTSWSLAEVHEVYESISGLKDKLVDISRESAKHQQVIFFVYYIKSW